MPASLGTATGLTGIPSLLLQGLQEIEDPKVKTALYQIQNWCNSVGLVNGVTGSGTPVMGTNFPGTVAHPTTWTTVTLNGVAAYIPVWT